MILLRIIHRRHRWSILCSTPEEAREWIEFHGATSEEYEMALVVCLHLGTRSLDTA